jgi:hypothetical protein
MFNLHSETRRVVAIDNMIDCFEAGGRGKECVTITDVIHLVQDPVFRPAVLIIYPITAHNDPDTLVGLTYGVFNWDTVLDQSIPSYVDGIVPVLSGGAGSFTFDRTSSSYELRDSGDTHDRKYNAYREETKCEMFANSLVYKIDVYPSNAFVDQYHTMLPVYALVAAVGVISITSLIFVLYARSVDKTVKERDVVLDSEFIHRPSMKLDFREIRRDKNSRLTTGSRYLHISFLLCSLF